MGSWLPHYIHALYDRYLHVSSALKLYPELHTICLDEACFMTPNTTVDFIELLKSDLYNLQVFSKMMGKLKGQFPKKMVNQEQYLNLDASVHKASSNRAVSFTKKLLAKVFSSVGRKEKKIIYHNAYFARGAEMRLLLKTGFSISPFFYPDIDFENRECSQRARGLIKTASFGENEFERILFDFIAEDIPVIFIEKYQEVREEVSRLYDYKPSAVMSATSWHYNDVFKLCAAGLAEKGVKLVGLQHGGNYGIIKYFLQERQELSIVDRFYSWGWTRVGVHASIVPLTPTKLVGRERTSAGKRSTDVLYYFATWSRYLIQFPLTIGYWSRYFQNIEIFGRALSEKVKLNLRLRPHREDLGWDVSERLKDIFSGDVPVETWDLPFAESLKNCCLFVCGHPTYSTTFIESLYINKPTILFYDPAFTANRLHPDAVEYYEDLKSAGMLFDSALDAAAQVNRVYERVDEWWSERKRQDVVNKFLHRFGRVSDNAMNDWMKELDGISNG